SGLVGGDDCGSLWPGKRNYGVFVAPPPAAPPPLVPPPLPEPEPPEPEPLPPDCPGTFTLRFVVLLRRPKPPPKMNQPMTSNRMITTTAQTAPEPPRDSPLLGV